MAYENLRVEEQDGIVVATFTREKALNALNAATLRELGEIIESVRSSKTARALILTGAGEKAFHRGRKCAGFDASRGRHTLKY